jgi:hypothetical protein
MDIDRTAAFYGLLQVAYADMTEHLATYLYLLRRRAEPKLEFRCVYKLMFRQMLNQFKDELKEFDTGKPVSPEVHELRNACKKMSGLADWRNDRIHARVRVVADGYALYDWLTGLRLSMTAEELERKIEEVNYINASLEAYMLTLLGDLARADNIGALLEATLD